MAQLKASIKFDQVKGTATITLEPVGATEMEHELLAQYFTQRSVSLVPFHNGDELEARFVIEDKGAFSRAQRACDNRIRVREGRPTVEQEEERKAAIAKAKADRETADKAAQSAGYKDAADQEAQQEEDLRQLKLAKAIVDEQERRAKTKA